MAYTRNNETLPNIASPEADGPGVHVIASPPGEQGPPGPTDAPGTLLMQEEWLIYILLGEDTLLQYYGTENSYEGLTACSLAYAQ